MAYLNKDTGEKSKSEAITAMRGSVINMNDLANFLVIAIPRETNKKISGKARLKKTRLYKSVTTGIFQLLTLVLNRAICI